MKKINFKELKKDKNLDLERYSKDLESTDPTNKFQFLSDLFHLNNKLDLTRCVINNLISSSAYISNTLSFEKLFMDYLTEIDKQINEIDHKLTDLVKEFNLKF